MKNSGVFFHCLFIHSNVCWVPVCWVTSEDTPGSPYEPETQMREAWGNRTSEQTRPPVWPWHLRDLLWCFWLRKKEIKPSSNEVHCVFVCLLKSLHLAILKGGLWLNLGISRGKNHKVWDLLTRKFPVVWQITVSTQPSSSERWRSHFQLALLLLLDFSSICLNQRLLYLFIDFSDLAITSWLPAVKDKDVALLFCPFFQWNCIIPPFLLNQSR